jgi:hypothetical protein
MDGSGKPDTAKGKAGNGYRRALKTVDSASLDGAGVS